MSCTYTFLVDLRLFSFSLPQGPNSTLHSRTPHLLDHLLTLLLPQPTASTLPTSVLPNILTALIHHVHSKPQGYEPVLEVLEKSARKELEVALLASNAHDEVVLSRLGRSLKSVVVVAAVRKGRCVTGELVLPPALSFSSWFVRSDASSLVSTFPPSHLPSPFPHSPPTPPHPRPNLILLILTSSVPLPLPPLHPPPNRETPRLALKPTQRRVLLVDRFPFLPQIPRRSLRRRTGRRMERWRRGVGETSGGEGDTGTVDE